MSIQNGESNIEETQVPLLAHSDSSTYGRDEDDQDLGQRIWVESEKLWRILGPVIFCRVTSYSMNVITEAFAGHLGNTELASIFIVNNVVVGFNFGLLFGMASALETFCGQPFGAKKYQMLGIYVQRSWVVAYTAFTILYICFSDLEAFRAALKRRRALWLCRIVDDSFALQLSLSVPSSEVLLHGLVSALKSFLVFGIS